MNGICRIEAIQTRRIARPIWKPNYEAVRTCRHRPRGTREGFDIPKIVAREIKGEDSSRQTIDGEAYEREVGDSIQLLTTATDVPSPVKSLNTKGWAAFFVLSVCASVYINKARDVNAILKAFVQKFFSKKEESSDSIARLSKRLQVAEELHERQFDERSKELTYARSKFVQLQERIALMDSEEHKLQEELALTRKLVADKDRELVEMSARHEMEKNDNIKKLLTEERKTTALQQKLETLAYRNSKVEEAKASSERQHSAKILELGETYFGDVLQGLNDIQIEHQNSMKSFKESLEHRLKLYQFLQTSAAGVYDDLESSTSISEETFHFDKDVLLADKEITSENMKAAIDTVESLGLAMGDELDHKLREIEIHEMRTVNQHLCQELAQKDIQHTEEMASTYFKMFEYKCRCVELEAQTQMAKLKLQNLEFGKS